jgi:hypothetical protein
VLPQGAGVRRRHRGGMLLQLNTVTKLVTTWKGKQEIWVRDRKKNKKKKHTSSYVVKSMLFAIASNIKVL